MWRSARARPEQIHGRPVAAPTRITGVSTAPGRGVSASVGLYEFDTNAGVPIRLHEANCVLIAYRPADNQLEMCFAFGPDWAPVLGWPSTDVSMSFGDVQILRWSGAESVDGDPAGQVSAFDWDGGREFHLSLLDGEVTFTAAKVHVDLRQTT